MGSSQYVVFNVPGSDGASGNATSIRGILVTGSLPNDGQSIVFNAASNVFTYSTVAGGGGGSGADPGVSYITIANTGSLQNERALAVGGGLTLTDGGANASVTLGINNGTIATISGSTFTKLSGSLQQTAAGLSYLVAIGGTSITSQSNGQLFVSSSNPPVTTIAGSGGITVTQNNGVFTISGSGPTVTTIAGSGGVTVTQAAGLYTISASAPPVQNITGQGGSTVTQAAGAYTVSSSVAAPKEATYLALNGNAGLSAYRTFAASTGITATDGGAAGAYTVAINNNVVATVSGTTFTGPVLASTLSGSLQTLTSGISYLVNGSPGSLSIVSQSNGQIIISASGGGGGGGSGSIGAPPEASYLTLNASAGLSAERVFTAGQGITLIDGGANSTLTISARGTADVSASYLVVAVSSSNPNNRSLAAGFGTKIVDAGAGSTLTIAHSGTTGVNAWNDQGGKMFTTSSVSIDSLNRFVGAIGTDVVVFISGSSTDVTGSNRKVTVFGGTVVYSGSRQEQVGSTKTKQWSFFSSSFTNSSTKLKAFSWPLPDDTASSVDVAVTAFSIASAAAASMCRSTLFRSHGSTVVQEGPLGGFDGGSIATSGSAWGCSIVNAAQEAQLWLTGSTSQNVQWGFNLSVMEITGTFP